MKRHRGSNLLLLAGLAVANSFLLKPEVLSSCQRQSLSRCSTISLQAEVSGPRSEGRRRAPSRQRRGAAENTRGSGSRSSRREPREREPAELAPFNGKNLAAAQEANEGAKPYDLEDALFTKKIRSMTPDLDFQDEVQSPAYGFCSLDDLFEDGPELGFSKIFNSDTAFRQALREAIRQDIFDTTPFYANLSEKAASVLLLPDSSLEGSWRMPETMDRMKRTTSVLQDALGGSDGTVKPPTGDELFQAIGNLCGAKPSTHWIDIFGVQDRKINHSWHLDSGRSPDNSRTVLLGFPPEDNYEGSGVFSHIVPLTKECLAPESHPRMEPILFDGTVDETFIVRPTYRPGRELIFYRDIDVIHSAPDVTYRTSIMRFM